MTTIRTTAQLLEAGMIEPEKIKKLEEVTKKFAVSLTPQLTELINLEVTGTSMAIRKQFLPDEQELIVNAAELKDPIGDTVFEGVKGVVHRYPDRCLLMPINTCPVYCRFCFRREKVGKNDSALTKEELERAFSYIESQPKIWEVILTGGDPLFLKPKKLNELLNRLDRIPHVEVVRIHTRVPAVDSARITEEMINALKINKALYVALHANHASEFTEPVRAACAKIVNAGIPMISQTVLLKGINDTPEALGDLMRTLVKNRIKPYYLHHADLAEGTSHFRTTLEEGRHLMKSLWGNYSGLCQPTYVLDIPGGHGKVPVSCHQYFSAEEVSGSAAESYRVEDYQGKFHSYKA